MTIKKIIFSLFLFAGLLFFPKHIFGAEIDFWDTSSYDGGLCCFDNSEGNYVFQNFTASTTSINKIQYYAYDDTASGAYIQIYDITNDGVLLDTSFDKQEFVAGTTNRIVEFEDIPLVVGNSYQVRYFNTYELYYLYTTTCPTNNLGIGHVSAGSQDYFNAGYCLSSIYSYDSSYPFTILWSADIILPSENYVYSRMPNFITYKYNNVGGLYDTIWFNICRKPSKTGSCYASVPSPHNDLEATTSQTFDGVEINLDDGFYTLYNAYFAGEGTNFISTPINFEVVATSSNWGYNASTTLSEIMNQIEETICDDLDLDTIWGQITCAFKRASLFMFKPSDSSIETFLSSYMEIKASFPFNAFFGLTDAFSEGIGTTTISDNSGVAVPWITATGTITSLNVLSSTSLPNLIGEENNNLFRNSIVIFAWLIAGFIIFFTIRKI